MIIPEEIQKQLPSNIDRTERDKTQIIEKCARCGKIYQTKFGSWRRVKDNAYYCHDCAYIIKKERFDALPEDEKKAYLDRKNAAISKGHKSQTPEQKALSSKHRKEAWANDPERHKKLLERLYKRWDNATPEDRKACAKYLGKGRDAFWANEENYLKQSALARERWYSQPIEEQERILKALNDGRLNFIANDTPEKKLERYKKTSAGMRAYYAKMTQEERDHRLLLIYNGIKDSLNRNDLIPNTNELAMQQYFQKYGLPFEYIYVSQIKHPDFDKLFKYNPYRPTKVVSYSHKWDFIVHTKNKNILIDIDGSIHNPATNRNYVISGDIKYILGDYIDFNDSKRPYQTDGLDAYIVQCYDDKLTDDTPVVSLSNPDIKLKVSDLISYLCLENMDEEILNEILNK